MPTHVVIVVPAGRLSGFAGWYRRSRTILRARSLYASTGWLTFCAPNDGEKKGLKSKPKIGGFRWDATTDVEKIRKEFMSHRLREQNIGLPTGPENGHLRRRVRHDPSATMVTLMALRVLAAWEAENGKLPDTLMAISPTGSVHRFFLYPADGRKVVSASNIFGRGLGRRRARAGRAMVLAAPSTRPERPGKPGGAYRWLNWGNADRPQAPEALLAIVCRGAGRMPHPVTPASRWPPGAAALAVSAAMIKASPTGRSSTTPRWPI